MLKTTSEITGRWERRQHLHGNPDYRCSRCRGVYPKGGPRCPGCGARMEAAHTDPDWLTEMRSVCWEDC